MPPRRFPEESEEDKISRLKRAMYSRSVSGTLRPRPRRELNPLDTRIPTDFETPTDPVGSLSVAPKTLSIVRNTLWWVLAAAILFFIIAAGVFVFYFFFGAGSQVAAPGNVDIAVRGPVTVSGGEPAEFQIVVTNRNQAALQLADLIVKYPTGTRSPTDLTTDLPSQRISLGDIEPGGRRQGTVTAIMVGTEGAKAPIHVEVEYRVQNSSAVFVASTDYQVAFSASPVSIAVDANDEAVSGQPFQLTISVSSNGRAPVKDALLSANYPFGFSVVSTDPQPSTPGFWELGDINPGDTKIIKVRGILTGEQQDERVFNFTVGTRRTPTANSIDVPLSASEHHVALAKPFLGLAVSFSKETAGDASSFAPNDTVNMNVAYQNNLDAGIDNAVIVGSFRGMKIDGSLVHTTDGFFRSSDNTVLWDKDTTNGTLAHLDPGEKGVVHVSFQVPNVIALATTTNPALDIVVHVAGKRLDKTGVPETLQATASSTIKVASTVQYVSEGFYNQNPFGSTGPLPPKVDQETTYAIVWALTNSTNVIKGAKVVGTLPPYVRWIGVYIPASEHVTFNATDGTITWDIGDIKPNVGQNGATPRQVAFHVGLTPSSSQIGQEPALIRSQVFTATDAFTQQPINLTANDVTTNIINDQGFSTTQSSVTR